MIGPAGGGKTSLINTFVNNFCPTVYTPTEDAVLYHRALQVSNPFDENQLVDALVEIEDTYAMDMSGKDSYKQSRDIKQFYDVSFTKDAVASQHPFNNLEYQPRRNTYSAMTRVRMGYMFVFDASDIESFKAAVQAVKDFMTATPRDREHIIYFVANKCDKNTLGNSSIQTLYQEEKGKMPLHTKVNMKLWEVSALEFRRVRKLFLDMVDDIMMTPSLYLTREEIAAYSKPTIIEPDTCSLQ